MIRFVIALLACTTIFGVFGCSESSRAAKDGGADTDSGGTCAPVRLNLEPVGRYTRMDVGWTGATHSLTFNEGSRYTLEVISCDKDCRRCQVHGPVPNSSGPVTQRCTNNTRMECSADSQCTGTCGGIVPGFCTHNPAKPCSQNSDCNEWCRFMFGTPFTVSGVRCSQVWFMPIPTLTDPSPIQGTINLETGQMDFSVFSVWVNSDVTAPCPTCTGDTQNFDGVRNGTCSRNGTTCDVAGISVTGTGQHSYECPGTYVTGFPLRVDPISTLGEVLTMDETRPLCTGLTNGTRCWCGVCDSPRGKPCERDGDCASGGRCNATAGTDGKPYVPTFPHACNVTGVCNWDPELRKGTCDTRVPDAGVVKVGCFTPTGPLQASGGVRISEGVYHATLGGVSCFPPSSNTAFDGLSGLPGPGFFEVEMKVTREFE